MDQKQTAALAGIVSLKAKMSADPVMVRFNKLRAFAEEFKFTLEATNDHFVLKDVRGRVLTTCDTTEELNEWFIGFCGESVL